MSALFATTARAAAVGALALAAAIAAQPAHAQPETVNYTIAATTLADPGTYNVNETIGTFNVASLGQYVTLIGATVSGSFGSSFLSPDTAPGVYSVGGVNVFTCSVGDDCWGSDTQTNWSYTFTAAQLEDLFGPNVVFSVYQTAGFQVQTGITTLSLIYYVPEPASLALFGASLLGLGLLVRRARA